MYKLHTYLFSTPLSSLLGQIIFGLVVDLSLLPRRRNMRHVFLKERKTYFTSMHPMLHYISTKSSKPLPVAFGQTEKWVFKIFG